MNNILFYYDNYDCFGKSDDTGTFYINLNDAWYNPIEQDIFNEILYFISHESLHIIIYELENEECSNMLDNITLGYAGNNNICGINDDSITFINNVDTLYNTMTDITKVEIPENLLSGLDFVTVAKDGHTYPNGTMRVVDATDDLRRFIQDTNFKSRKDAPVRPTSVIKGTVYKFWIDTRNSGSGSLQVYCKPL